MTVEINCSDIELHMQSDSRHGLAYFTDLGKNKYTFKRTSGVIHSTAQIKAGATSFYCPNTSTDYLRVEGKKENFHFIHQNKSSWTIQTWCYLSSTNSTSSTIMSNSWNGDSHDGFRFYLDHTTGGSKPTFDIYVNWTAQQGYKSASITTNESIPTETWVHLAVVYDRDSSLFTIYINGEDSTAINNTWAGNVLLRPAGKSLDIFRNDDVNPHQFHGFLQDIQIASKAIYLVGFIKSDELMFDRCSPAVVNLKIPGRPDYIYYFDGETTKCYRKTNFRVYDGGITLGDDHIAATKDEHDAQKASKPVLIYNSCEQCLGLKEFYLVSELGTTIKYGDQSTTDVQNIEPGQELIDIKSYEVKSTTALTIIGQISDQMQAYPEWVESPEYPLQYTIGQVTIDITCRDISSQQQAYDETPGDISIPKPIISISNPNRNNLQIAATAGFKNDVSTMFPGVDISSVTGGKVTRREGTSTSPAPADNTPYDTETKQYIPQPFSSFNNSGAFGTIKRAG